MDFLDNISGKLDRDSIEKGVVDLTTMDSIDSDCPSGKGVVENRKWYTTGETESHISIHVGKALLHSYEMGE